MKMALKTRRTATQAHTVLSNGLAHVMRCATSPQGKGAGTPDPSCIPKLCGAAAGTRGWRKG